MNKYSNIAIQYAKDIITQKIIAGSYIKFAAQRFINDLESSKEKDFEYYFDEDEAERICNFFHWIRHIKGPLAGKTIQLQPWQVFYYVNIVGWLKKSNNKRRYRYSYLQVARKNAKTTMLAALMLYGLAADREHASEIYCFGMKRDQARLLFDTARLMVKASPELGSIFTIYQHRIEHKTSSSVFKPMASKTNSLDGLNTHFAALDEVHEYPDDKLYNVIKSSTGARDNSHTAIITTAGFSTAGFCYQLRKILIKVLEGKLIDDRYFIMIYELDEGDDWNDKQNWSKANPNLGISTAEEYLLGEYQQALNFPTEQSNFQVKHLNYWQNSKTGWITSEQWKECEYDFSDEELKGVNCWGGLDMSSTRDFTAFSLIFDISEDVKFLKTWLWLPDEMLLKRARADKNMYQVWKNEELIRVTPGNVIDAEHILYEILNFAQLYNIQSIGYDRKFAITLASKLEDAAIQLNDFPQHMKYMCPATKQFEILVLKKQLLHEPNETMSWMMSNIQLFSNYNGDIKPDKGKSSEKIDGPVSAIIALGEHYISIGQNNYYDNIAPIEWI